MDSYDIQKMSNGGNASNPHSAIHKTVENGETGVQEHGHPDMAKDFMLAFAQQEMEEADLTAQNAGPAPAQAKPVLPMVTPNGLILPGCPRAPAPAPAPTSAPTATATAPAPSQSYSLQGSGSSRSRSNSSEGKRQNKPKRQVQAFACEECRRSKKTCKRTASKSCQRCKSKGTSCIASVTDGRYKKGRLTQTPDEPEVVQAVDNVPRALDAAQGAQTIDMPQPANLNMPIVDEARAAFSIAYCMAVWAGAPCTNVAPEAARLQDLVARVLGRPLPVRSLLLLAGQIPRWMDLAAPDRRRMDATADQMWSRVAIVEPAWIQGQPSGQSVHAALWNMISSAGVRGSWVWHCVLGGHWERALRTVSGSW